MVSSLAEPILENYCVIIACITQTPAFFQNISRFYTFLTICSNILPSLNLFCPYSEKSMHALTF